MPHHDPQKITITICGDGGCGKSSITLRLVRSQWTSDYDPTIEDSYSLTRTIDGSTYHLSLTDTAGQEEYRGMWASSNLQSDAFLLVYDITNLASLDCLQSFVELIDIEADVRAEGGRRDEYLGQGNGRRRGNSSAQQQQRRPVPPVKIVAGNKCDLQNARQVPAQVGLKWAKERGCGFMETSARNTVNIEETFALIVRRVVQARREAWGDEAVDGPLLSARKGSTAGLLGRKGSAGSEQLLAIGQNNEGTRRAVTAPLSPLPGGPEKNMGFPRDADQSGGGTSRFKEWLRRLKCW